MRELSSVYIRVLCIFKKGIFFIFRAHILSVSNNFVSYLRNMREINESVAGNFSFSHVLNIG